MQRRLTLVGTLSLAISLHALVCLGDSYRSKDDNRVVCLDARTGKTVWEHIPDKLNHAHFELYPAGLVVQRSTPRGDSGPPLFLDAQTGKPVGQFKRDPARLLTRSPV